jgi:hypothetical protein
MAILIIRVVKLTSVAERIAGSDEVRGSIPLDSIIKKHCNQFLVIVLLYYAWLLFFI